MISYSTYRLSKFFTIFVEEIVSIRCDLHFRVYCRAIKIRDSDDLLWYELGLGYYLRALKYGNESNRKQILDLAVEATKHTIKLSASRWKSWNLLGVICTTKGKN